MKKTAIISECGKYRYQLTRIWDESLPLVMFIMLNPSTADAEKDDATIRRCIGFAKHWGNGGIIVGNLFACRSTDPEKILSFGDPVGPENIKNLGLMASRADTVICAWGNGKIVDRVSKMLPNYHPLEGITNLRYIDLCNDGTPKHPLYLKKSLIPQEFII